MVNRATATVLMVISLTGWAPAQSDGLSIFGYFQSSFQSQTDNDRGITANSFNLNQLNLFLQNDFSGSVTAFVNFEMTNGFTTDKNIGDFRIEEAWIKYTYADWLAVKAGALIPTFNNLNEIKNRTPLLPYVFRPIAYESTIGDIISLEDYVPQKALVQVEGRYPAGDVTLEYAVFAGNNESAYQKQNRASTGATEFVTGSDTVSFKMIGGRVGVRYDGIKAGVSVTSDKDFRHRSIVPKGFYNAFDTTLNALGAFPSTDLGTLGDVDRVRLGVDLSVSKFGFTVEGEVIMVTPSLTGAQQAELDKVGSAIPVVVPTPGGPMTVATISQPYNNAMDKLFYYGYLGYDVTDQWTVYGGYSYLEEKLEKFFADGMSMTTGGVVYRPMDRVVLKGQYQTFALNNRTYRKVDYSNYLVAVSVFF